MKRTAVILIADEDPEIAFFALAHLDRLLKVRGFENAILLSIDAVVLKSAGYFSKKILAVRKIEKKQADDLLQLACLYKFDERFICASIDLPTGRNGSRLVGKKNISKEEVFAVGVYGLYPFEQAHAPVYNGEDPDILAFMKGKRKNDS